MYPLLGFHTDDDVRKASQWLMANHSVDSLQVRWVKDPETESSEKIPDHILVNHLRKEIGSLNAYIEELEDKIKSNEKITQEERNRIKKTKIYHEQKAKIKSLEDLVKRLRKDKDDLIIKLNRKT